MNMNSRLQFLTQFHFKLLTRTFVMSAIIALALGAGSYFQQCNEIRETERACAISDELRGVVETFGRLRKIGEGRLEEMRQDLNLKLVDQQKSLEAALESADENTRAFVRSKVVTMNLFQRQHPAYYAIERRPGDSAVPK